jgi:cystathionine beta-lyase/cystathionine gamma-synthase
MSNEDSDIRTQLIHAGEPADRIEGAVCLPVFQSATFAYEGGADYHDLRYIRLNNTPNHTALEQKLSVIAGGESAVVTSSGMSAIAMALMSVLETGDHLLAQNCLYGGTYGLVAHDLPAFGVAYDLFDGDAPEEWADLLLPETRAVYVETMSNPLLEVADLEAVVAFAREHDLVSLIDNTFASPINFRPLDLGFDIELHSCTKYLNGHSDIVAGCAIGSGTKIERIRRRLNHFGGCLDPHACFLLHRGMKTLSLRVREQNENARRLARLLVGHPRVLRVSYPALETHPQFDRAAALFEGCGGVLSFEIEGEVADADALISRLELPVSAPSLGGVESLITRPVTTTHSGLSQEEQAMSGITERLIRVSVGIEAADDLCADFEQALERV